MIPQKAAAGRSVQEKKPIAWAGLRQGNLRNALDGLSGTASRTIQDEIDRLKGRKTTKAFLGVISLITGVVSTVYALAPVEVTAGPNQVAVNYRYNF